MTVPIISMCIYRVQGEQEKAFREILQRHWPTLRELGLADDAAPLTFRGVDPEGKPFYVEFFTWRDQESVDRAHQLPEVLALWEPMEKLCEKRRGQPAVEFPHVERVQIHG